MTPLRAPMVAGLAAGAGTTTVATALRGHDGGSCPTTGGAVPRADVLLCRGEPGSMHRLATRLGSAARSPAPQGSAARRPLLVVSLVDDPPPAGLWVLAQLVGQVIVLPHVPALREGSIRPAHLAALLAWRPERLDGPLRTYADALRALAGMLVVSGALTRPVRPASGPELWRGLVPVERRPAAAVARLHDDLDDLALEGRSWRAAG